MKRTTVISPIPSIFVRMLNVLLFCSWNNIATPTTVIVRPQTRNTISLFCIQAQIEFILYTPNVKTQSVMSSFGFFRS